MIRYTVSCDVRTIHCCLHLLDQNTHAASQLNVWSIHWFSSLMCNGCNSSRNPLTRNGPDSQFPHFILFSILERKHPLASWEFNFVMFLRQCCWWWAEMRGVNGTRVRGGGGWLTGGGLMVWCCEVGKWGCGVKWGGGVRRIGLGWWCGVQ